VPIATSDPVTYTKFKKQLNQKTPLSTTQIFNKTILMKGVIAILKAFKDTKIMEAARNLISLFFIFIK
jgi:hypothetical protein